MSGIFVLVGFIGFNLSLVKLVIQLITKKDKKTTLVVMLLFFITFAFGIIFAEPSDDNQNAQSEAVEETASEKTETEIAEEQEKQEEETPEPTAETVEKTAEVETPELYKDFFEPYTDDFGKLNPYGFSQAEKLKNYKFEYQEGNEIDESFYKIYSNENDDYVYMLFFPDNVNDNPDDWTWSLSLLTYERGEKEISLNDNYHTTKPVMNTFDKDREPTNEEVKSIDELITFMFGENEE